MNQWMFDRMEDTSYIGYHYSGNSYSVQYSFLQFDEYTLLNTVTCLATYEGCIGIEKLFPLNKTLTNNSEQAIHV